MRKFFISAALVTAAIASVPATAQYGGRYNHGGGQQIANQLGQISQRIDRAYQRRLVSPNEARWLQGQVQRIDERFRDYRRNGLTQWEHQDLQQRIQNLRQRLQFERQEGREQRRDDRYDDRRDRRDRW